MWAESISTLYNKHHELGGGLRRHSKKCLIIELNGKLQFFSKDIILGSDPPATNPLPPEFPLVQRLLSAWSGSGQAVREKRGFGNKPPVLKGSQAFFGHELELLMQGRS
jgi:hypothetical protein